MFCPLGNRVKEAATETVRGVESAAEYVKDRVTAPISGVAQQDDPEAGAAEDNTDRLDKKPGDDFKTRCVFPQASINPRVDPGSNLKIHGLSVLCISWADGVAQTQLLF